MSAVVSRSAVTSKDNVYDEARMCGASAAAGMRTSA